MNDRGIELSIDLVNDNSLLTIGLDVRRHSVTDYHRQPSVLSIKRPIDVEAREFEIYIIDDGTLNQRSKIAIVPSLEALLNTRFGNCRPNTLPKRLHRLMHGHPDEITNLCRRAGHDSAELKNRSTALN